MPGQSRRKKMSFLRTLQKQGAVWPCVAFIIVCLFSARMMKHFVKKTYVHAHRHLRTTCMCERMNCTACSNLCGFLKSQQISFLFKTLRTLKSLLEETTCVQPGRWCCCVGSTHTQWPAYAPWALGYRLVYMIPCLMHRYILYYRVLVMQLHTIYGWICAFCVFMCLLQPTWTGSLVIVLF